MTVCPEGWVGVGKGLVLLAVLGDTAQYIAILPPDAWISSGGQVTAPRILALTHSMWCWQLLRFWPDTDPVRRSRKFVAATGSPALRFLQKGCCRLAAKVVQKFAAKLVQYVDDGRFKLLHIIVIVFLLRVA